MRRVLLLFLFVITSQVSFSQFFQPEIYFEANYLPDSSGATFFISYRIAYSHLVFIKQTGVFTASFSVTAEVADSLADKHYRDIVEKTVNVSTYDETTYDDKYIQGVLLIKVPGGNYKITPIITDYNADKELRSNPLFVDLQKTGQRKILPPIIIEDAKKICKSDSVWILANINGDIPFSRSNYDMVIPVMDSTINELEIQISSNDSVFSKSRIKQYTTGSIEIGECDNQIYFKSAPSSKLMRFFYLPSVNSNLQEGPLEISVSPFSGQQEKFNRFIRWQNKPKSLRDIHFAGKILKYIADENEVDKIVNSSGKQAYREFMNYWKKLDPTPKTSFNELMSEFYERADYSIKNFSLIGSVNGAETDRGKIYIQFGKPDDIRRVYSNNNDIKEIWTYKSAGEQFIFTDKSGMGNFVLSNSL